ncbi:MAG: hypothetical protein ACE5FG_13815 [Myxococcota bacterium]
MLGAAEDPDLENPEFLYDPHEAEEPPETDAAGERHTPESAPGEDAVFGVDVHDDLELGSGPEPGVMGGPEEEGIPSEAPQEGAGAPAAENSEARAAEEPVDVAEPGSSAPLGDVDRAFDSLTAQEASDGGTSWDPFSDEDGEDSALTQELEPGPASNSGALVRARYADTGDGSAAQAPLPSAIASLLDAPRTAYDADPPGTTQPPGATRPPAKTQVCETVLDRVLHAVGLGVGVVLVAAGIRLLQIRALEPVPGPAEVRGAGWVASESRVSRLRDDSGSRALIIEGKLAPLKRAPFPRVQIVLLDKARRPLGPAVRAELVGPEAGSAPPNRFRAVVPEPRSGARRFRVELLPGDGATP